MDQSRLVLALLLLLQLRHCFTSARHHPYDASPGCIRQRVPLQQDRICACLPWRAPTNASATTIRTRLKHPSPSPVATPGQHSQQLTPAESPAVAVIPPAVSISSRCATRPWKQTSWCICKEYGSPKPASKANASVAIKVPLDLTSNQIRSLFPANAMHDIDQLKSCGKCLCPALKSSFPFFRAPPRAGFSPDPEIAPRLPVMETSSVCMCTNCTALSLPPAESPGPAPETPAPASTPAPEESDGHDWEEPGVPRGDTIPVSSQGVAVLRKQPPPHVTVTHEKDKQQVLAYVLPVAGFLACIFVFIGVVFGRNLLCWRSSSSSRFSHLESEI